MVQAPLLIMLNQDSEYFCKELQPFDVKTTTDSISISHSFYRHSILKRKYDQMNIGEHSSSCGQAFISSCRKRATEGNDKEIGQTEKKIRTELTSHSPGSCGASDVTAEHYMAESSKSSCFDDACTLALETAGTTVGESAASTQEFISSSNFDLNAASRLQGPNNSTVQEVEPALKLESLHTAEPSGSGLLALRQKAGPFYGNEYRSAQLDRDSAKGWLQLGLGSSAADHDFNAGCQNFSFSMEHTVEEQEAGKQTRPELRLFPHQPEFSEQHHTASRQQNLMMKNTVVPETPEAYNTFLSQCSKFVDTEPSYSSKRQQSDGFMGFLRSIQQQSPDTKLVISYNTTAPSDNLVDMQHRNRLNAFGELAHTSAAASSYQDGVGLVDLQQQHIGGYPYGISDGHFRSSMAFDDMQSNSSMGNRNMENPGNSSNISGWSKQEGLHSFQQHTRPGLYVPYGSGVGTGGGGIGHASSLYPSSRNLPTTSENVAVEDWQGLMKRVGGGSSLGSNMHFQSLLHGNPTPKSSDGTGAVDAFQRLSSSNLQDLRAQWKNQDPRSTLGTWSTKSPGYFGTDTISSNKRMPFSFDPIIASNLRTFPTPGWQATAAGIQLPYLSLPEHQQQQHQQLLQQQYLPSYKDKFNVSKPKPDQGIWFVLRASENQGGNEYYLPQIPKGYLRVKDGTVPVSYVKKYLVHKLGLSCESEVEITCRGQQLMSNLSLQHVRDVIWYDSSATAATTAAGAVAAVGDDDGLVALDSEKLTTATNVLMVLNYSRKKLPTHHSI